MGVNSRCCPDSAGLLPCLQQIDFRSFYYLCPMRAIIGFGKLLFSNFYIGTSICFLIWITFFDGNDLITLAQNHLELAKTESEIQFYQEKYNLVLSEQKSLNGSPAALEKFARERYLMRRDNEDVFVVEEAPNSSMFGRLGGD